MLGMDLVPPAAYRTGGIGHDYKTFDAGAFMYWVHDAANWKAGNYQTAVSGVLGADVDPRGALDTRVLDVLLHNSGQTADTFFGRHWTGGPDESESDGSASLGGSGASSSTSLVSERGVCVHGHENLSDRADDVRQGERMSDCRFLDAAAVKREFGFSSPRRSNGCSWSAAMSSWATSTTWWNGGDTTTW